MLHLTYLHITEHLVTQAIHSPSSNGDSLRHDLLTVSCAVPLAMTLNILVELKVPSHSVKILGCNTFFSVDNSLRAVAVAVLA